MKSSINASGLKNLIYIDLGFTPEETAAGSGDGIHYYKEFSQRVYDKMIEKQKALLRPCLTYQLDINTNSIQMVLTILYTAFLMGAAVELQ